ncbi:TetR/AcrR family transcriptional regulator [Naasia sp. SYSU D00057]|uniref:TetR/AcrR family transcriptional regulator n=1 Tax=Naasia sp. SYSU D00057 TaxID=2817380 RepID=UPI001B30491B|nr:TetR/AcrR family transcriptional regulator [Naasia sp. SYSU D00057]
MSTVRGREARDRLLRAAAELIAEYGWTAVTTRMVADRAGIGAGLVHYHFESVAALLAEAAITAARGMMTELESLLAQSDDPLSVLLGMLDDYSGRDPMSLLLVEAYLAASRDVQLRQELGGVVDGCRRMLEVRLAERGVPDASGTAIVLAAAVDGLLLHRALTGRPSGADIASVLRQLLPTGGRETS